MSAERHWHHPAFSRSRDARLTGQIPAMYIVGITATCLLQNAHTDIEGEIEHKDFKWHMYYV